jgi:hypothetical protein
MTFRSLGSLLAFLPLTLAAQSLQEHAVVPLHNWSAPRHLQRSQVQTQQRVLTPKSQLPGGVTPDSLIFVPIEPCRLADTRPGSGYPDLGSTPLTSLTPRNLFIAGSCGVPLPVPAGPPGPEAYSLNVTVVPPSITPGGYLLVYPNPAIPVPLAASLTWTAGAAFQTNAVITADSSDGSVNLVVDFPTNVVVDINGYYSAPTNAGADTALGSGALANDTLGIENTALGLSALYSNSTGSSNTAIGYKALWEATEGSYNVALGDAAMGNGPAGFNNSAVGSGALYAVSGSNNIAVGYNAGLYLTAGNYNIMIGGSGTSTDDHTIRIGEPQTSPDVQTSTYIAGILGNTLSGASNVVISSTGQLGVQPMVVSSRRYKDDIQDMGYASSGLLKLRPVTFHYKKPAADGSKPLEYGLIAEEVADVYPELVIRGADGQIESVQYAKLPAMLLNEVQKQQRQIQEQRRDAEQQRETIKKLETRLAALEAQLVNATAKVTSDKILQPAAGGR